MRVRGERGNRGRGGPLFGRVASSGGGFTPWFPWEFPEVLAYWDARQGVTAASEAVSAWASTLKGALTRSQGTGARQPLYVPHDGANYFWSPGVTANQCQSPTKVITGNMRITIDFAAKDWTPTSSNGVIQKTATNLGFNVILTNTGKAALRIGTGTAQPDTTSNNAHGWADNTRHTLRIDWQDGVGATFFFDGVQDGAQVPQAVTMADSTAAFFAVSPATLIAGMKVYSVSVTDGASTTYYSVDFTRVAEGTTSFSQNGDTYTVNATGAKPSQIIGRPWILHDGTDDSLSTGAITLNQPCGLVSVMRQNSWTSNDGLYSATAVEFARQVTGTPKLGISAGSAVAENTNLAVATKGIYGALINGASSYNLVNLTAEVTGNAGANNPSALISGVDSGGTNFGALQETALALVNMDIRPSRMRELVKAMARVYDVSV